MPPVPYPPLRDTFPSRGRRTIRGYHHLKCGEAATSTLSPSCQSTHSTFIPPSFGRRCPEGGGSWLSKRDEVVGSTVFPVIPLLTSFLDRKRKRFLAFARNDDAGRRHTPSFLWKEVPRRGGGAPKGRRLALEAVFSLAEMPTPPRFARPSSRGRGENDP